MCINPEDLEVTFLPEEPEMGMTVGARHTSIRIKHIPTGVSVECGEYRAMYKNKNAAMNRLRELLNEQE